MAAQSIGLPLTRPFVAHYKAAAKESAALHCEGYAREFDIYETAAVS